GHPNVGASWQSDGWSIKPPTRASAGVLAHVLAGLWDQTHHPYHLIHIRTLGTSCLSNSIKDIRDDGLWHPLWLSRYYHQTRDPACDRAPTPLQPTSRGYVIDEGQMVFTDQPSPQRLSIIADAWKLTGEPDSARLAMAALRAHLSTLYREPGTPWDGYRWRVGEYFTHLTWGYFKQALVEQGGIDEQPNPGQYPQNAQANIYLLGADAIHTNIRFQGDNDVRLKHGELGMALNPETYPLTDARTVIHPSVLTTRAFTRTFGPSSQLYRLRIQPGNPAYFMPFTGSAEALEIKADLSGGYRFEYTDGYLLPMGEDRFTLRFTPYEGTDFRYVVGHVRVRVADADGKALIPPEQEYYLTGRRSSPLEIIFDPKTGHAPWRLQVESSFTGVRMDVMGEPGRILALFSHHEVYAEQIKTELNAAES
ncbi:MAG: hypothetical protein AAF492_04560, partial [Verrucomicrobiota bacterium]